jgi:hypothetical protein
MPIVPDTYRGTTTYVHVLAELIRAAQYRGTTTYQDIAAIMGLPTTGNYMSKQTGRLCGEISEDEVRAGRPMLSAVAVKVGGTPGPGFYPFAKKLGRMRAGENETDFWKRELEAVYKAWRRPLPKKK